MRQVPLASGPATPPARLETALALEETRGGEANPGSRRAGFLREGMAAAVLLSIVFIAYAGVWKGAPFRRPTRLPTKDWHAI